MAALFLVFTVLQAIETMIVLVGMCVGKISGIGVVLFNRRCSGPLTSAEDDGAMSAARPMKIFKRG